MLYLNVFHALKGKTADLRSCSRREGRYRQSHSCIHSHLVMASLVSQIRSSPIVGSYKREQREQREQRPRRRPRLTHLDRRECE